MLIRGEVLIDAVTVSFTVSGKRGEWKVTVTGPGAAMEDETVEASWFPLWTELVTAASDTVKRKRSSERMAVPQ